MMAVSARVLVVVGRWLGDGELHIAAGGGYPFPLLLLSFDS